jgi:hypothetical protein
VAADQSPQKQLTILTDIAGDCASGNHRQRLVLPRQLDGGRKRWNAGCSSAPFLGHCAHGLARR